MSLLRAVVAAVLVQGFTVVVVVAQVDIGQVSYLNQAVEGRQQNQRLCRLVLSP
jgi:hypothetical protein